MRPGYLAHLAELRPVAERPPWRAPTHQAVDANGVPVEWVEAAVATVGQPTIVYFHRSPTIGASLNDARLQAVKLAVVTGARVLTVDCATVRHGVIAYAWLLAEGLDLDTTTFLDQRQPANGDATAAAVRRAARYAGLPLPRGPTLHLPGECGGAPT